MGRASGLGTVLYCHRSGSCGAWIARHDERLEVANDCDGQSTRERKPHMRSDKISERARGLERRKKVQNPV
ncbi:hypothetical protein PYCCODRAFT_1437804 [Trametes coccinea BRFM310]|uniref:Uncharacterized protein n=1 Tax=Trametes coccinea (strain BRFM310) TaxID=1353009 RepID=A0A1Y2IG10_TRAC3|nr:hypothetical protein PYCCODRAFT_1437804 [Trametes coccinea BRFM310]